MASTERAKFALMNFGSSTVLPGLSTLGNGSSTFSRRCVGSSSTCRSSALPAIRCGNVRTRSFSVDSGITHSCVRRSRNLSLLFPVLGDVDVDDPDQADIDREGHLCGQGRLVTHAIDAAAGLDLDADSNQSAEISAYPRKRRRAATFMEFLAMLTSTAIM